MKRLTLTLGFALIAASSGIAQAASHEHDMSQHQMVMQSAATHTVIGILKAVNSKAGKVQIAHEAVAALGWPAMSMWFALRDPIPQNLKVGDSVRFEMMENDNKQWVIVKIERK